MPMSEMTLTRCLTGTDNDTCLPGELFEVPSHVLARPSLGHDWFCEIGPRAIRWELRYDGLAVFTTVTERTLDRPGRTPTPPSVRASHDFCVAARGATDKSVLNALCKMVASDVVAHHPLHDNLIDANIADAFGVRVRLEFYENTLVLSVPAKEENNYRETARAIRLDGLFHRASTERYAQIALEIGRVWRDLIDPVTS